MQEAYIVAGFRTAVTKSKRGGFRFTRPDDLAVEVIKGIMKTLPELAAERIDDVIVGNAVPEAEQGLQFGRIIAARALGIPVAGITINRYCGSGLESIAMATAKIRSGMAECIVAGGTESMSLVPTAGWKTVPSYEIAKDNPDYYLGMGLTAEAVAVEYSVSREDQDAFSFNSHVKAAKAIDEGYFKSGILPIDVEQVYVDEKGKPGFWYGTGFVSYGLAVFLSVISFLLWWLIVGISLQDNRVFYWLIFNAILLLVLQPWLMRLSRVIYIYIFVSFDANYKENLPQKLN